MIWPWLPPRRGDIVGLLFAIFLISGSIALYFSRPWDRPDAKAINFGFGPEWECTVPDGGGGPICLRKARDPPSRPSARE